MDLSLDASTASGLPFLHLLSNIVIDVVVFFFAPKLWFAVMFCYDGLLIFWDYHVGCTCYDNPIIELKQVFTRTYTYAHKWGVAWWSLHSKLKSKNPIKQLR